MEELKGIEKALESIRSLLKPGETVRVHITLKPEKPTKASSSEK